MNGILDETEINNCIMSCKYTSTISQYIRIKHTSIGLRVSSQHHSSTAVFHSFSYINHFILLPQVFSKHISLWNNKGRISKFRFFCFDFCILSIYFSLRRNATSTKLMWLFKYSSCDIVNKPGYFLLTLGHHKAFTGQKKTSFQLTR